MTELGVQQLFMIKDVARLSGHSIHTVKFYLKLGLIKETGRSPETKFRYFDQSTLERLALIRSLRRERKSLAEIKQRLDGGSIVVSGADA